MKEDYEPVLYWDSAYAIAMALLKYRPELEPEVTGLHELADIVEQLPGFVDEPTLVNERLLLDIQIAWYEEITDK